MARTNTNKNSADEQGRAERPKRIPLYDQRSKLVVKNGREDMVYRVVNDRGNRIFRFRRAGWEHVLENEVEMGDYQVEPNQELGNVICVQVNSDGTKGYLMCLPKELYDEDQATKAEEINRLEEAMEEETRNTAEGRYGNMKVSVSH